VNPKPKPSFLASLNYADIISKVLIAVIPLTLGWCGFSQVRTEKAGLEARHDSLLMAFAGPSAMIDTVQGRDIKWLKKKARTHGLHAAVADTVVVLERPGIARRALTATKNVLNRLLRPFRRAG
jgi:hypothetical protein